VIDGGIMKVQEGKLKFTADSSVLKELGEKLVAKPAIALAELIKNAYDADATEVHVIINTEKDKIVVMDNGHGMTFDEFRNRWMRIGTREKRKSRLSKNFGRVMTGSKGVGRMSVQFLAKELTIQTVSDAESSTELIVNVEWKKALENEDDLTEVETDYQLRLLDTQAQPGTTLILKGLKWLPNKNQKKLQKEIDELLEDIWYLQPPSGFVATRNQKNQNFKIFLDIDGHKLDDEFTKFVNTVLDAWWVKIEGSNNHGKVDFTLQFHDREPIEQTFIVGKACKISGGTFKILFFHLERRKPKGIQVGKAREYLARWGGVHVYDDGFRIPYYGVAENDWLRIEFDHSQPCL
jgi:anti-sigma regulatory factor (Ser/Thr protein kinase)